MHERYLGMVDRGMPKVKAIVAISRKLLRIIFALVRNHSTYRENYDHLNCLVSFKRYGITFFKQSFA
jgi:hypothetical protein